MRCNACWRELEGRAISTACGHLLCTEDANKILSNDGASPICEQFIFFFFHLRLMKPVDTNPNEEWINMAMSGICPQIHILFCIPKCNVLHFARDLEMQYNMNRLATRCRQKCEGMQAKFREKLEQAHAAYQKMGKRCQMMEQEVANLAKIKKRSKKFSEKSRRGSLMRCMTQLRSEYESVKRTAIQPANNFYPRHQEPDFFSNPPRVNMMENREPTRKDRSFYSPGTPGPRDEIWPARPNSSHSGPFDISNDSPAIPSDLGNRRAGGGHPVFGGGGNDNPQSTLRNVFLSVPPSTVYIA
ncbi:hypothetical protein Bca52824_017076 [Brassica carinata]|uniref:Uncharacterized protein n=1 Tax=Brassica carinata TaxID=52824 RepID=A0A8X7VMH9_BRACI|nr:hypothetical protein Bca52824_017076 [Brassica carinata]